MFLQRNVLRNRGSRSLSTLGTSTDPQLCPKHFECLYLLNANASENFWSHAQELTDGSSDTRFTDAPLAFSYISLRFEFDNPHAVNIKHFSSRAIREGSHQMIRPGLEEKLRLTTYESRLISNYADSIPQTRRELCHIECHNTPLRFDRKTDMAVASSNDRLLNTRLRPSQRHGSKRLGRNVFSRPYSQDRYVRFRPRSPSPRTWFLTKSTHNSWTEKHCNSSGEISRDFHPFRPGIRRRIDSTLRSLPPATGSQTSTISTPSQASAFFGLRRQFTPSMDAIWSAYESSARADTGVAMGRSHPQANHYVRGSLIHRSRFLETSSTEEDREAHSRRLALAFEVDRPQRTLDLPNTRSVSTATLHPMNSLLGNEPRLSHCESHHGRSLWRDNEWVTHGVGSDAPALRDDFYCSTLAYSVDEDCLAVGLAERVYLWTEEAGVRLCPRRLNCSPAHVTSLSFSAAHEGCAILAVGRADGTVTLWSQENEPRFFHIHVPSGAACVSFSPVTTKRPSRRHWAHVVDMEVLLVRDEAGRLYIFLIEWPDQRNRSLFGWHGAITLHVSLALHTQQICGIAWSADGDFFATGGNDNLCNLFDANRVLLWPDYQPQAVSSDSWYLRVEEYPPPNSLIAMRCAKHQWSLSAAVKAVAFCPWQRGLVAVGGGSNDRCIHFYHTISGAPLATIDCAAQVTALIWSDTRREIAATFGFAQPEHPYRIAVYTWPECQQVVAIPWPDNSRALHAIPYRGRSSRTVAGECIVVAASDGTLKFHEIRSGQKTATFPSYGLLGGSNILESMHGIEKEGVDVIR